MWMEKSAIALQSPVVGHEQGWGDHTARKGWSFANALMLVQNCSLVSLLTTRSDRPWACA